MKEGGRKGGGRGGRERGREIKREIAKAGTEVRSKHKELLHSKYHY